MFLHTVMVMPLSDLQAEGLKSAKWNLCHTTLLLFFVTLLVIQCTWEWKGESGFSHSVSYFGGTGIQIDVLLLVSITVVACWHVFVKWALRGCCVLRCSVFIKKCKSYYSCRICLDRNTVFKELKHVEKMPCVVWGFQICFQWQFCSGYCWNYKE